MLYAYFLPQFEGMTDEEAAEVYKVIEPLFDLPELSEARRAISEVLGVDLVV